MQEPEWLKYPFTSKIVSFKRVVNMKQKDNESVLEYLKGLKQAKEFFEAHFSKDVMGNYVENRGVQESDKIIGQE